MKSECNVIESVSFSTVESFSRKNLIKALELELLIQTNGKLMPSFQDVKQFTFQALDKTSGHVPYAQLLTTKFPEVAVVLASIGVVKAFSNYADYSSNADSMFHALRILMYATPDQIAEIDLLVVGGLYRFVNEKIIQPFEARLRALEDLIEDDLSQKNIVMERIEIYRNGVFEATQLVDLLRERVRVLEDERDAVKSEIEQKNREVKEANDAMINRLELKFKAGLISQEEYAKSKLKLNLENVGYSISGVAKKTILSLKNNLNNDNIISYSNNFFGEIYDPIRQESEMRRTDARQTISGIAIMVFVFFLLFVILVISFNSR